MLELSVKVININFPSNHPILGKCRPLYEYSWFIQQIKVYLTQEYNRDEAIIKAIGDCMQMGYMTEFLREHGTEAVNMLFTEFNMEDALEVRYEEGMTKGEDYFALLTEKLLQDGRADDLLKASTDKAYRNQLYHEYSIQKNE